MIDEQDDDRNVNYGGSGGISRATEYTLKPINTKRKHLIHIIHNIYRFM